MLKHPWILAAVLVLSLSGGFYAYRFFRAPATIDLVYPRRGPVVEAVYGLGTVVASHSFQLKTGVTTEVRKLYVRLGDRVQKGAPLVQLGESGLTRAPFSGIITALPFQEGENVFPQTPLLTLDDTTSRYIEVSLEQHGALRVREGMPAVSAFESLRGRKFPGRVRAIFPSSGQFLVHIDLKEFPEGVLPGMTTDVAIEVGRREDALLVPLSAIANGKIILLDGRHRKKVSIEVGVVDGESAEVLSPVLPLNQAILARGR